LRNQFPTTAESAEGESSSSLFFRLAEKKAELIILGSPLHTYSERRVNAQAAKEAAAEKSQAVLLELDAFRGVHLDPNAHHWDDVSIVPFFSFPS